jgi:hypothetical protein
MDGNECVYVFGVVWVLGSVNLAGGRWQVWKGKRSDGLVGFGERNGGDVVLTRLPARGTRTKVRAAGGGGERRREMVGWWAVGCGHLPRQRHPASGCGGREIVAGDVVSGDELTTDEKNVDTIGVGDHAWAIVALGIYGMNSY